MKHRHELFDELDAFCPNWQKVYNNLPEAAEACIVETPYVADLYADFLITEDGLNYLEQIAHTFDYRGAIERQQQAEDESALPFKRSNLGNVPGVS